MSITLDENAVRRWRNGFTTTPASSNGAILPSWQSASPNTGSSAASTTSSQSRIPSILKNWPSQKWTGKAKTAMTTTPTPPTLPGTACQKESYLCVNRPWTSVTETKLSTLVVTNSMADDYDLFIEARKILSCAQGNRIQRFFTWQFYTRVVLSEVSRASSSPKSGLKHTASTANGQQYFTYILT